MYPLTILALGHCTHGQLYSRVSEWSSAVSVQCNQSMAIVNSKIVTTTHSPFLTPLLTHTPTHILTFHPPSNFEHVRQEVRPAGHRNCWLLLAVWSSRPFFLSFF